MGLNRILDSPTSWNSLLAMLERFVKIYKPMKIPIAQLDEIKIQVTEKEIKLLKDLIDALTPLKLAIEKL